MKKFILIFLATFLFIACKKSKPDVTTIKYEFTSDISVTYQLDYATSSTTTAAELFTGTSWSQSVIVSTNSQPAYLPVARLTVDPPTVWENSTNSAHVNLKISVNGVEKANADSVLTIANVNGISAQYNF